MTTLTPAQTTQLLNTLQQLSNNLSSGTAPIATPGGGSTVTPAATPTNIAGSLQGFVPPEFTEGMASINEGYKSSGPGEAMVWDKMLALEAKARDKPGWRIPKPKKKLKAKRR